MRMLMSEVDALTKSIALVNAENAELQMVTESLNQESQRQKELVAKSDSPAIRHMKALVYNLETRNANLQGLIDHLRALRQDDKERLAEARPTYYEMWKQSDAENHKLKALLKEKGLDALTFERDAALCKLDRIRKALGD